MNFVKKWYGFWKEITWYLALLLVLVYLAGLQAANVGQFNEFLKNVYLTPSIKFLTQFLLVSLGTSFFFAVFNK